MKAEDLAFYRECLRVASREICDVMWSPRTEPTKFDVAWAWMDIHGLTPLVPAAATLIAAFLWLKWKFRKRV